MRHATWTDESINKNIRDLASRLHSLTFEEKMLRQMNGAEPQKVKDSEPVAKTPRYSWE